MRHLAFTHVYLLAWGLALQLQLPAAQAVCACAMVGSLASFEAAPSDLHARNRASIGVPPLAYWAGHYALHLLPLALLRPPTARVLPHGATAAALHLAWGWAVSGGTLRLDRVYVPAAPAVWRSLWCVALVGDLVGYPLLCGAMRW